MWQRFTERARKVVFYAQEEAQKVGEGYVSTEHLLLGLIRESDSIAAQVLEKLGVSLIRIREEVEKRLTHGEARPSQDMTLTARAKRVIDLAYDEARILDNDYIGTEHLLLGLIREGDGVAGRVLFLLEAALDEARQAVFEIQQLVKPEDSAAPQSGREEGVEGVPQPKIRREVPSGGMWQRFSEQARRVVFYAQEESKNFGEGYVSTEHFLLGLTRETDCVAMLVLAKLGIDPAAIRAEIEKQLPVGETRPSQDMTLTPRGKRVIDLAYEEARNLNNNYIGTEHLLLGLIAEDSGLAGRVLAKFGLDIESARREVMAYQDHPDRIREPEPPSATTSPEGPPLKARLAEAARSMLSKSFIRQRSSAPEFIAAVLLADGEINACLVKLDLSHERATERVQEWILANVLLPYAPKSDPPAPSLALLLSLASEHAINPGQLTPGDMLLAFFVHQENPLAAFLREQGVTFESLRAALKTEE